MKKSSNVPVPETKLFCSDPEVIGTPFFIYKYVEGRFFKDPMLKKVSHCMITYFVVYMNICLCGCFFTSLKITFLKCLQVENISSRTNIYKSMLDTLAKIHSVNLDVSR